jgi:hypothetical protein
LRSCSKDMGTLVVPALARRGVCGCFAYLQHSEWLAAYNGAKLTKLYKLIADRALHKALGHAFGHVIRTKWTRCTASSTARSTSSSTASSTVQSRSTIPSTASSTAPSTVPSRSTACCDRIEIFASSHSWPHCLVRLNAPHDLRVFHPRIYEAMPEP